MFFFIILFAEPTHIVRTANNYVTKTVGSLYREAWGPTQKNRRFTRWFLPALSHRSTVTAAAATNRKTMKPA